MRKVLIVATLGLLVAAVFGYAQRPPDFDVDGVPFLKVNINPTAIPPQVNINPNNATPRVEVTRMPEVRFTASGCAVGGNFRTAIGQRVTGPFMLTYLNLSEPSAVTLRDNQGAQQIDLSPGVQISTAIYLAGGQTLEFASSVLYSGCVPD